MIAIATEYSLCHPLAALATITGSFPTLHDFLHYRQSIGDRPARPRSGSLSGRDRTHQLKPRQPSISYKLDLATEGSHHPILWEEERLQTQEENSGSSEEMEEVESEQPPKDEELEKETTSKPMSEGSSPDEDDFFARSSKY